MPFWSTRTFLNSASRKSWAREYWTDTSCLNGRSLTAEKPSITRPTDRIRHGRRDEDILIGRAKRNAAGSQTQVESSVAVPDAPGARDGEVAPLLPSQVNQVLPIPKFRLSGWTRFII